jgi:endo-1,4-beta-xylanase
MKMEYIVQPDGSLRFDAPDAIAAYGAATGKRLWGHALIWYSQEGGEAFARLDGSGARFAAAYRNYIDQVMNRYPAAVGWDVVNEPIAEDGDGYRDSIWRRNFGMGYVDRAFEHAAELGPTSRG